MLLIIPAKRTDNLTIQLHVNNEIIPSQAQLKVLGSYLSTDCTPIADMNKTLQIWYSNKPEPLEEIRQKSRKDGQSLKSISKSKEKL